MSGHSLMSEVIMAQKDDDFVVFADFPFPDVPGSRYAPRSSFRMMLRILRWRTPS